ncbi:MAG: hypothetical protein J6K03_07220 [Oscillospiraceae bacterium]|nr:hypothetical protein [Oscillospiraceae bacterium]
MKKPHVVIRILLGIISVVLSIALFVGIFTAMVIGNIRVLTNKDNLQTFISEILFATPKKHAPVILRQGVGVGGVKLDEADTGMDGTQQMIVDYVYDMLKDQFGDELPVSEEKVEELLSESTVPEFLSEKMASIMSDVLTGETTTTITSEEVVELIQENSELIQDTFGVEITQEHLDAVSDWVEEADITNTVQQVVQGNLGLKDPETGRPEEGGVALAPEMQGSVLQGMVSGQVSVDNILNSDIQTILALFREVTSVNILLTILGACAVLVVLLFLVNYWKPYAAVRCVGITAMIAALPFLIPTVLVLAVPAMFAEPGLSIVALVLRLTSVVCIGLFVGGVVLLAGSIVWGTLVKKKARAVAAAPVVQQIPVMPQTPAPQVIPVQQEEVPAVQEELVTEEPEQPQEV